MHPITTPSGSKYLIVEVPEDAIIQGIDKGDALQYLELIVNNEEDSVSLPEGDYEIIGCIKLHSMDEGCKEMAGINFGSDTSLFVNFEHPDAWLGDWQSSVRSLLTYNKISIKEGEKLLIIKKV